MDMMNGPMMGVMMFGGGLLLVAAFLVLSLVALVKYLRSAT